MNKHRHSPIFFFVIFLVAFLFCVTSCYFPMGPETSDTGITTEPETTASETDPPETNVIEHIYGEWVIEEPTCTENGKKTRTCQDCSEEETLTLLKLGHKWSNQTVIITEATATESGVRRFTCTVCGHTQDLPYTLNGDNDLTPVPLP